MFQSNSSVYCIPILLISKQLKHHQLSISFFFIYYCFSWTVEISSWVYKSVYTLTVWVYFLFIKSDLLVNSSKQHLWSFMDVVRLFLLSQFFNTIFYRLPRITKYSFKIYWEKDEKGRRLKEVSRLKKQFN